MAPANNRLQRTALRAAAEPERWADIEAEYRDHKAPKSESGGERTLAVLSVRSELR